MVEQNAPGRVAVQVVVRTHKPGRPVRRAVESVLRYPDAGVIVVAHGVSAEDIDLPNDARVSVVEVDGRLGFPGAASNAGIAAATAQFVGLLDSDDYYEDGAVEAMHRRLVEDEADAVLAPLKFDDLAPTLLPLTGNASGLDVCQDRLFYRTAPLGLFRTSILQDRGYEFSESVKTGEDLRVTAKFFTQGHRVSYHRDDPAYVVTDEATDRVTTTPRDVTEVFKAIWDVTEEPWVQALPSKERQSLAVKILRIHVLKHLLNDRLREAWKPGDFAYLQALMRRVTALSPTALGVLNYREERLLTTLLVGDRDAFEKQLKEYQEAPLLKRVLPKKPWKALQREANIRNVLTATMLQWLSRFTSRFSRKR